MSRANPPRPTARQPGLIVDRVRNGNGRSLGPDQRSRLIRALVELVAERGYARVKVGELAERAGVSRATFYHQFTDKEQCFAVAHGQLAALTAGQLERTLARADPSRAAQITVRELGELAQREPHTVQFLTHEALLAGPQARDSHDRMLERIERAIERSWQSTAEGPAPDVPARILVGGALRLLSVELRRNDRPPNELPESLTRWVDSYVTERIPRARRDLLRKPPLPVAHKGGPTAWVGPRTLPRGRHRLPKEQVDSIQRERIAYGAAQATYSRDASRVAVSEIVAAAGVSREVFYAHFADKEHAFLATYQLVFGALMAASSNAFFVPGRPWPERVWAAGKSFAEVLAAEPSLAHFAFVSSHGVSETGIRRIDETMLAFGLFLEEGYRQRSQACELPRATSDAIAAAIMEAASYAIRNGQAATLPELLPAITYMALAPFLGSEEAGDIVDRQLAEARTPARSRSLLP